MINKSLAPNVNTTKEEREQNNERGSAYKTKASIGTDGNITLVARSILNAFDITLHYSTLISSSTAFCPAAVPEACGGHGRHSSMTTSQSLGAGRHIAAY